VLRYPQENGPAENPPDLRTMKKASTILTISALALATVHAASKAEPGVKITTGSNSKDVWFKVGDVPSIAKDDAASDATFTVVSGEPDEESGPLDVLHDDSGPTSPDSPEENFFFGSTGRIEVDLGKLIDVKSIDTYSWHVGGRAPQFYKVYVATGTESGFNKAPKEGTDPASCGWKLLGEVDTRPETGSGGGQHGAEVASDTGAALGKYQHVLFDINQGREPTFFSEIDVIDANAPEPKRISAADKIVKTYDSEDGKYHYVLDASKAPDLIDWTEKDLLPVVKEWYPKLVALLPSEGYTAPETIHLRYVKNISDGTPAFMTPDGVTLNAKWFRTELKGEAKGAVIHELVHVVQAYELAPKNNPEPKDTPSWVVEGIADYVRWFIYEPQSKGAEISKEDAPAAKFDESYRTTANFMDFVNRSYGGEVVKSINAAARDGKYSVRLWKKLTGKKVEELADEWKAALAK
jgi:hypothetical protein